MKMPNAKFQSSEKEVTVNSGQWSVKKQLQSIFLSIHCSLSTVHSQRGVAQLAIVMLLVAGVAVGTYVVQNRTNFFPKAVEPGYCEEGYTFNGGDAGDDNNWSYTACGEEGADSDRSAEDCNNAGGSWSDGRCYTGSNSNDNDDSGNNCNEDTTYCDNGRKIHKTGGYWDGSQCVYDYRNEGSCGGSSDNDDNDSDSSKENCERIAGATWRDGRCYTPASSGSSGGSGSSDNTSYDKDDCRDGAQVYKDGYTWITYCNISCSKNSDCPQNTTDGAVNPETSNWCYGFNGGRAPRCMKLVQSDNREVNDTNRKSTNSKAVEEIKSTIAQGGDPNPATTAATQSSSAEFRAKVNAQNKQRSDLTNELATVLNNAGSGNSTLTGTVNRAQSLITSAASSATTCYTGIDRPLNDSCDATAQAAHDIAVAASRVALFDAVAAGVPSTCVKVDMAVGANTSNSLIEVAPAENTNSLSRLFMCRGAESRNGAKDGDVKWRVRDNNGSLQEVSQDSLTKLGLRNGQKDISSIPTDFVARRNNAAALSSQPTYSAPAQSTSGSTEWKEVAVSICRNNCSNFPNNALCYQRGNTNQYNCGGQSLNALCPGGVCP